MTTDFLIIGRSYLISLGLQVLAWPWLYSSFKFLADRGWILGRVLASLLLALAVFIPANWGFEVNNNLGIAAVIGLLVVITLFRGRRLKKALSFRRVDKRLVMISELLFLFSFFGLALVRGYAPEILGLEKFMDYGFIKSYLSSDTLPANDMWLAGEKINYYSFGHFWTSFLVRLWGVPAEIGYNLMLAFILATSLGLAFNIIVCLLNQGKKVIHSNSLIGAGIGSLLVTLGGNSHHLWYFLKNKGVDGYWYADATRFIPQTIHEFPGYSFVVSDLHAHLLDLPIVLSFLLLSLVFCRKAGNKLVAVIMGLLLGIMAMTNTWDVAIYGLMLLIISTGLLIKGEALGKIVRAGGLMGLTAAIAAWTWWRGFDPISQGIQLVSERSSISDLTRLWLGQIMITGLSVILVWRERKTNWGLVIISLALTAVVLLVIPEIIYARDIYPSHPRANTMFKLTYQAFILMAVLFGVAISWLFDWQKQINVYLRLVLIMLTLFLAGGLMIYPLTAFDSYYAGFKQYKGLDGLAWFRERKPEEAEIAAYLDKNKDGQNMVEAVGDSYTEFNAISAFSGVPTILGWRVHEWLWRGGYEIVAEREAVVGEIYEGEDSENARVLMEKYNVGWVVVGKNERDKYQINEQKLLSLGEIALKSGDSYLIRVTVTQ
ncbi:hypothetical protein HY333_01980 [Candidatus Collierbacteria bacterium]|nr:hypothetical protein [Candidatus Collierbacteria bacterium]